MPRSRFLAFSIAAAMASACPLDTHAQTTLPADAKTSTASDRAYLLGGWNGARSRWASEGFNFRAHYASESAWAPGYGARYTQQIDIGADLDLGKLWGWRGSQLHFTVGDRVGRDLGQDRIHTLVQTQEIYGVGQDARLYEMSYQYVTPGKHFDIKAGWMPLGNEFGHSTIACQFESLFFCGHPLTMSFDSGWYNNPKASWGFRMKWGNPLVYAMVGAYNTNPTYPEPNHGFKLNLSGTSGVVIPAEIGLTPGLASGVMPGHYMLGAYYDSSDANNLYYDEQGRPLAASGDTARQERHRTGYYVIADQMVWQDPGQASRGLVMFADFSQSDLATARYRRSYEFGLVMKSPFVNRPDDSLVLGEARLTVNPRLVELQRLRDQDEQSYEQVTELAYSWQVNRWFSMRPGVQYLERPGGLENRHDVWVGEFTLKATL